MWGRRVLPTNRTNSTETVVTHPGDHNAANAGINRMGTILGDGVLGPYAEADEATFTTVEGVFRGAFQRIKDVWAYLNDTVSVQLGDLSGRVSEAESDISTLQNDVSNLDSRVDSLESYAGGGGWEGGGGDGGGGTPTPGDTEIVVATVTAPTDPGQPMTDTVGGLATSAHNYTGRGLYANDQVGILPLNNGQRAAFMILTSHVYMEG